MRKNRTARLQGPMVIATPRAAFRHNRAGRFWKLYLGNAGFTA